MKNKIIADTLFKNTSFYALVGLLPSLTGFISLPITSRFLSPDDFGVLSLITTFTTMLAIFGTFQIYSSVSRLYFDLEDKQRYQYFSTLFYLVVIIGILLFAVLVFFFDQIISLVYSNQVIQHKTAFLISAFTLVFSLPMGITTAFFKVQQRAYELAMAGALSAIVSTAVSLILIVKFNAGINGAVAGSCFGSLFALIWHSVKMANFYELTFNFKMIVNSLRFSLPVVPHALGGYLFMYSDILILEKYVELAAIGIYAISSKFALLLKTLVNAFNNAVTPIFFKRCKVDLKDGVNFIGDISQIWYIILAISYALLCHAGEYIIRILTPASFHDAAFYVPILALCYIFRGVYIFPLNTFYFCKKTKLLAAATLTSGTVNVGLNLVFIPIIGLVGAVLTTVFSFFLNFVILTFLTRYSFKLKFCRKSFVEMWFVVFLSNLLFYSSIHFDAVPRMLIQLGFCLFLLSYFFIRFHKEFKGFLFSVR